MKLTDYIKEARNLVVWGVIVGLVLGGGVWLVALNDLGARLATVGAFIVAILTPLIAFIANNFITSGSTKAGQSADASQDSVPRNSRIIVISALVAFIVAIGVVWATPRVMGSVENYFYYSHDVEAIDVSAVELKNNTAMKDGDVAYVTLPETKHRQLKIQFALENQASTTLCANAATLKISGPAGGIDKAHAGQELRLPVGEDSGEKQVSVQLVFLPETDPSCHLDIAVASAAYYQ